MNTCEKLDKISKLCNGGISITQYGEVWQIYSYHSKTPLSMDAKHPYFENKSFRKLIDETYTFVVMRKAKIK